MSTAADNELPMEDAANQWFARARSGAMSAQERDSLRQWRLADAKHEAAYTELEQLWSIAGKAAGHEAVRAMRAAALDSVNEEQPLRRGLWVAIAASVLLVIGGGYFWTILQSLDEGALYSTAVGQRSTLTLDDGSIVVLNTASQVRVRFSSAMRNLDLLSGQAIFEVAKDVHRPFVVQAAGRRITALGTAFEVRLDAGNVRVTLLDGRVAVEDADAPKHRAELLPGQQVFMAVKGPVSVQPTNVERVTSWREGRLIFDNEPLSDVIAEVNRYSQRQLVLKDASLRELKISGTFRTGSPAPFVAALREYFPIEAHEGSAQDDLLLEWRNPPMR